MKKKNKKPEFGRIPLPKQTGGAHKNKKQYNRKKEKDRREEW